MVINILGEKYLEDFVSLETDFDDYLATETKMVEYLETMPIFCSKDNVAKAARNLSGCAWPCGVDTLILRSWGLQQGFPSGKLRKELTMWVMQLSKESPDYVLYRVMNASRVHLANKKPGVQSLAVGKS